MKISGFKSSTRINWPSRILSYRIALVIAQLPDFVWDKMDERYKPIIRELEKRTVSKFSEWQPCSTELIDLSLSASFAEPALQHPGTTVVVAMGIEVSASSSNLPTLNPAGFGTMKIVAGLV